MGSTRWRPPLGKRRGARLIAVGAAGPGMGKSIVASNLAVALAGLGPQVVLVDLDLAAARQQALFGLKRTAPGVQAFLERRIDTLESSLTATGIRNLHLVTGATPASGRALPFEDRLALVEQLGRLDGDVVVVDVGAANRDDLWDFFATRALRVLVTNPDAGAIETSYAFLKAAALRAQARYGAGAREVLARFRGRLVGNNARAAEEAEAFHAFSRLVRDHLRLPLPVLGCLRGSERIAQSVEAQRPLLARRGLDENVRAFHAMAEALSTEGVISDDACDLGVEEPPAVAGGPLPVGLETYVRQHPRYPVDWAARLDLEGRAAEVRVIDVSFTGAAVEGVRDPRAGDRGTLTFHQLRGQPSLAVTVKNVVPSVRRIGISFDEPGELSSRLVAAASALAVSAASPAARV
jgi:MinD-like ATPase involved in chromosome partitioning or flagellar assembly